MDLCSFILKAVPKVSLKPGIQCKTIYEPASSQRLFSFSCVDKKVFLPLWISISSQLPLGSHRCRQYTKIITEHQQNKFSSGVFLCISAWGFILSNMLLFIHTFAWKTRTHARTRIHMHFLIKVAGTGRKYLFQKIPALHYTPRYGSLNGWLKSHFKIRKVMLTMRENIEQKSNDYHPARWHWIVRD